MAMVHRWRNKYGQMSQSDANCLRLLDCKALELNKVCAAFMLNIQKPKSLLGKSIKEGI
ncbi:hypothetical protein [Rubritalea tangerina]|uniref:hypothetical protein n=1 Tax=Rubritalea tangerina TaxID=430798 RepID=UPI003620872E